MEKERPELPEDPFQQADKDSATPDKKPFLKVLIEVTMRYVLPLAVTVLLVYLMFTKVSIKEVWGLISHGVDYWWILLAMALSVLSHIVRAARWRLQLRGLGMNPPFMMLCCSIFGTYGLNIVFPRLGEVWRCAYVSRQERQPFTRILGSMVADRLSDTITVALLLVFTFIVASGAINSFLTQYSVGRGIVDVITKPYLWITIILCVVVGSAAIYFLRNTKIYQRGKEWLIQAWRGFAVIASMEGKWLFLVLTVCLWSCYFFQMYLAFFAFDFTRELVARPGTCFGLTPCLVAWVLSSIGMAIPSNGGLGPWNIACMFGLAVYGISDAQGTAFSVVVWSAQTVMLLLLGIFTMGYIMVHKRKEKQ